MQAFVTSSIQLPPVCKSVFVRDLYNGNNQMYYTGSFKGWPENEATESIFVMQPSCYTCYPPVMQ